MEGMEMHIPYFSQLITKKENDKECVPGPKTNLQQVNAIKQHIYLLYGMTEITYDTKIIRRIQTCVILYLINCYVNLAFI